MYYMLGTPSNNIFYRLLSSAVFIQFIFMIISNQGGTHTDLNSPSWLPITPYRHMMHLRPKRNFWISFNLSITLRKLNKRLFFNCYIIYMLFIINCLLFNELFLNLILNLILNSLICFVKQFIYYMLISYYCLL